MQRGILEPLFDALPVGVIVLDRSGRVIVYNEHEEQLAGRRRERVLGRQFFTEIAPCLDVRELAGAFREKVEKGTLDERVEVEFPFPHIAEPRSVLCRLKSFVADDEPCGLILVEDISMQRAIEQLKTTLAALLVHDLKSPLAVALANVDLAIRDVGTVPTAPGRLTKELEAARTAGVRLHAMIVDLLDIARMQTGTLPVRRSVVDIAALLRSALEGQHVVAERRCRRLVSDITPGLEFELDPVLLRRILDNLIDNAIRHSPPRTTVSVRASRSGANLLIEVADEGKGVPAELRERIFDPYVKASDQTATEENRGLGLTFVQLATRAHGGDIHVLANQPSGAIFRLCFPEVTTRPSP